MAVGLTPESWALLAFCGVLLSLVASLFAIEPGLILMPVLALLLPRTGVPAQNSLQIAAATAIVLLIPLSIARLGLLHRDERRRMLRLAPAIFAGAFFGGSLLPLMPVRFLLAGYAILAAIALMHRPVKLNIALAVTAPSRAAGPFTAISKSTLSALFGIGLPLSEGRRPEKSVLTLLLGTGAAAALFQAPPSCKGCPGLVFMPALIAVAAGAVLKMPLLTALFGETSRPRLRPVVILAAVIVLLAAPLEAPGTGKTALATLAPGLCHARPQQAIAPVRVDLDPFPALVQRFGPRRGLVTVTAGRASQWAFVDVARQIAAHPPIPASSAWTAVIEIRPPQKPAKQSAKQRSSLQTP